VAAKVGGLGGGAQISLKQAELSLKI